MGGGPPGGLGGGGIGLGGGGGRPPGPPALPPARPLPLLAFPARGRPGGPSAPPRGAARSVSPPRSTWQGEVALFVKPSISLSLISPQGASLAAPPRPLPRPPPPPGVSRGG